MHIAELLKRVSKRDSALIYCEFFYAPSLTRLNDVSYEYMAIELSRRGCFTSRGAEFTAVVVRSCVMELTRVGALVREQTSFSRFNLFVPEETVETRDANVEQVVENEKDKERKEEERPRASEIELARVNENINNKLINKSIKQFLDVEEKGEEVEESAIPEKTIDSAMSRVDFDDPNISAFRAKIVDSVYEPGVHADLIDRIVVAKALGIASEYDIQETITRAKEERETHQKSNGFRGKKFLWQTICPFVKNWFESAGYRWIPTSFQREQAPRRVESVPSRFDEEQVLAAHDAIRSKMVRARVARVSCA